jgi:homoserine kinase
MGLEAVLVVPDEPVATEEARAALPEAVPIQDAVFNVAHGALLMLGIGTGDWELIAAGLEDRIHQPYREHLYPRSADLVRRTRQVGALGATVSGAGPTVLVWCQMEHTGTIVEALREFTRGWATVLRAPFEPQGADVRSL